MPPQPATVPGLATRAARLGDVPAIHALIAGFAAEGLMLSRTLGELYETVRDFVVAEGEVGGVCGCTALHIVNGKIAELKSLAVAKAVHGRGVGRLLVEAGIAQAAALGLERVFCLTYQREFFTKLGFTVVDRSRLPEKVWSECVRCNKFLSCDEIAMWRAVEQPTLSSAHS